MEFFPNYYGLVFVSSVGEPQSIKNLFIKTNSSNQQLINNLRSERIVGAWHQGALIISSPHILDFLIGEPGPFAQKLIQLFPSKTIFATYYYSVTSQRGICKIINSKVEKQIYINELNNEFNVDILEEEYLQKNFGYSLPTLLGKDIQIAELDL